MRNLSLVLAAATVMFGAAAAPLAAQHPDFTGTWVLNPLASEGDNLPTASTATIVQHGDTLTVDREATTDAMGTVKVHVFEAVDGKPWKNTVTVGGQDIATVSTLAWAHDTLVITTTGNVQGYDFTQDTRIILSADGKTMTNIQHIAVAGQDQTATTVFVKKP